VRVLWLTNDLPPRTGGIQQFVGNLLSRVHPEQTVVVGPDAGAPGTAHDAAQPYRTVRAPGAVLPTRAIRRLTVEVAREHRPDVVVLGASWPLGELAGTLRTTIGVPVVGLTHGLEAALARPVTARLLRRATRHLDAVTTISDWTSDRLAAHLDVGRVARIPPGVDVERFTPEVDGRAMRERWGIDPDVPLVGCISRLVARKGQDQLVAAWPQVRARHPQARLVLVGEGPAADRLQRAVGPGDARGIVLTGPVAWDELPAAHAALDLFAMPCRTRLAGLDVEGLGIVYLEAQASAVPVIAGRSGGAPEAVRAGVTGSVVDGRDRTALVATLDRWLADPAARERAGAAGRDWMLAQWSWTSIAARFAALLDDVVAGR
jgi:phosphatidyl-myo-inositol dimannoside synthase